MAVQQRSRVMPIALLVLLAALYGLCSGGLAGISFFVVQMDNTRRRLCAVRQPRPDVRFGDRPAYVMAAARLILEFPPLSLDAATGQATSGDAVLVQDEDEAERVKEVPPPPPPGGPKKRAQARVEIKNGLDSDQSVDPYAEVHASLSDKYDVPRNMNLYIAMKNYFYDAPPDLGAAERVLLDMRTAFEPRRLSGQYNAMIKLCLDSQPPNYDRVEHWYRSMLLDGVPVTVRTFGKLINAESERGNVREAERWVQEMIAQGVEVDLVALTTMLKACGKAKNAERAEYWFKWAVSSGLKPDSMIYNTMIKVHLTVQNVPRAEAYLEQLRETGAQLTSWAVAALIQAYTLAGDSEKVNSCLQEARAAGFRLDRKLHEAVLQSLAKSRNFKELEDWVQHMAAEGVRPSADNYGIVVQAYADVGDHEAVERWSKKFADLSGGSGSSSPQLILSQLQALVKSSDIHSAERQMETYLADRRVVNVMHFNALITGFAHAGDLNRATYWFERIAQEGELPNAISFDSMILACSKAEDVERAENYFKQREKARFSPTEFTYAIMIGAYARIGAAVRAERMFDTMVASGLKPTDIIYAALLKTYCGVKGPRKLAVVRSAWSLFDSMLREGVRPNYNIYDNLFQVLEHAFYASNSDDSVADDTLDLAGTTETLLRHMIATGVDVDYIIDRRCRPMLGEGRVAEVCKELGVEMVQGSIRKQNWNRRVGIQTP
mmetsp:Transcript_160354/g.514596  ORF Transcript_160354/g.514596 Transcript_160354/m.514596 type:complete len:720 (+) Transcript_160354:69-2228(+)